MKVGGKVLTSTSVMGKFKPGNIITVSSPSTSGVIVSSSSQNSNMSANSANASAAVTFDLPTISNVMSLANQSI